MIWVAFTLFAIGCAAHLWFLLRVAAALQSRHPAVYRQIYGLLWSHRLFWFVLLRKDKRLHDPELSTQTKRLQIVTLVSIALFLWTFFTV